MAKNSNSSGLHTIIRVVPAGTEAPKGAKGNPPTKKLMIIDTRRRKAVDPIWARVFDQHLRYYLVSNSDDPIDHKARGTFDFSYIEDPPGKRSLNIAIDYAAVCPPGNERMAAEALSIVADPTEALKSLISKWIDESVRAGTIPLIDSFSKMKDQLVQILKRRAKNEIGFNLEIDLVDASGQIPPFTEVLPVRFRDLDRESMLRIRVELQQINHVAPQVNQNLTARQVVQAEVRKYFADHVNVQSFHFDLSKDGFKRDVLTNLNLALAKKGYKITFLSMESEGAVLSVDFEIATNADEEQFKTNNHRFPVALSIAVSIRLTDLKGVRSRLNSGQDVQEEIKKDVLKTTAQFLRNIDPGRFYLRFNDTREAGERPVKQELSERITLSLSQNFGAQVCEITLRVEETDVTRLLNDLKRSREEFQVLFKPLSHIQPYDVVLSGNFRVTEIDYYGWNNFVTSLPPIDQVRKRIEDGIRMTLQNDANVRVVYQDTNELQELTRMVNTAAQKAALQDFGLRVTINNLGRERTDRETRLAIGAVEEEQVLIDTIATQRQLLIKNITAQIGTLRLRLADAIIEEASEEQMRDIRIKIAALEKHLGELAQSGRLSLSGASETKQLPGSTGS